MKFTAETKAFSAALAFGGRVIPSKTTLQVLTCIKIVAGYGGGKVTLIGSNMDTTFEVDTSADIEAEGVALIPFDPLVKFISAAKGTTVEIELDKSGAVTVKSGRGKIVLQSAHLDDYPQIKPVSGDLISLDAAEFVKALRFAVAAASSEETRYYLCGAYLREKAGGLELWGTNGAALHYARINDQTGIGDGAIIPTDAAHIIIGMAEKSDLLHLFACNFGWHVACGNVRAFGKVIDGTYPDCDRVVNSFESTGWDVVAVTGRDDLSGAMAVAAVGADTQANKARSMVLRGKEGEAVIARGFKPVGGVKSAGRAEMEGRAKSTFAGVVNSAMMGTALQSMAGDVELAFCDQGGAGAFRVSPAQSSAVSSMFAIVMGLRAAPEDMADE